MDGRIDLHLDGGSEEAEWAHRLAREMLFARVMVTMEADDTTEADPRLWAEPVARALQEAIGGRAIEAEVVQRFGYLMAALTTVGFVAVETAGQAMERAGIAGPGEGTREAMPLLARMLEHFGQQGKWL